MLLLLQVMRQFQTMSRGTEARDFNLLQDNASYVQTWSAAQCFIVMLCTVVQVRKKYLLYRDTLLAVSVFFSHICISVVDPDFLNPDPDTDQDPAFQVKPDPDPGFNDQNSNKIQLKFCFL